MHNEAILFFTRIGDQPMVELLERQLYRINNLAQEPAAIARVMITNQQLLRTLPARSKIERVWLLVFIRKTEKLMKTAINKAIDNKIFGD